MNWSFPLFRIFGIEIRVHWFMLLMIGILLLQAAPGGPVALGWVAAGLVILIISILFHEFGHCWMAIRQKGHAEKILIWPLGGLSYVDYEHGPVQQIKVSGIGPLSSFVLSGIFYGSLVGSGAHWDWGLLLPYENWVPAGYSVLQVILLIAARLNLFLGLFNLVVPAYPLDGGQVLFGLLTLKFGRLRAAQAMVFISVPVGAALALFGFSAGLIFLGLIGLQVIYEAFQLRHLIRIGELEAHPAFGGSSQQFDYMPDRPKKKGWFARWKEGRARRAVERESVKEDARRAQVDAILDKVSREGIGSLSPAEKKILDDASRRGRGE
ncbi:MAG TPA: site-2 protease family protein [Planctomycetota bacterium]|jgi:Zn-dependent protease|nr:site-2 protease family protein [Planctomycetota bacterium]